MRADDALGQAFDGEVLEANVAVRLAGGMDDDEIPGMAGLFERIFDALVERLGDAHQGEAIDGDRGAIGNRSDGLCEGGDSHCVKARSRRRR